MSVTPAVIRSAVLTAAMEVADLLVTVTHEAKTGTNGDGKPTYAAAVERVAFIQTEDQKIARVSGQEVVKGPTVWFFANVIVGAQDRITLPGGSIVPIINVKGIADPAGGVYYAEVVCGRPVRGAVTG